MGEKMTIKTLAIIHELLTERVDELEAKRDRAQDKMREARCDEDNEVRYVRAMEEEYKFAHKKWCEAKEALEEVEAHDFR